MAGMYLPGTDCLLHSLQLRFIAPIIPPATLLVRGVLETETEDVGRVSVTVSDSISGTRYVQGTYGFGRHEFGRIQEAPRILKPGAPLADADLVLVTGASGAVGRAVLARLGSRGVALSRAIIEDSAASLSDSQQDAALAEHIGGRLVTAIVHCGWPAPDNETLLAVSDIGASVEHHVAAPLKQMLVLARVLKRYGAPGAMLVFLGSTAADPGRHNFRMPLYSLAKSMVPVLTRALAVELGAMGMRVAAIVLDVIDGGMNERMSRSARVANAGRSPFGLIPTPDDVAQQIDWLLQNNGVLASGTVLSLTGGAIP
jgi:NAD(P)-dependent dehydrogenase (short-subunit alcohol dehydrogenase family)